MNKKLNFILLTIALNCFLALAAQAQTTTFTYQGRLSDSGTMSGAYDLQFTLYDETGAPIATITRDDVPVAGGVSECTDGGHRNDGDQRATVRRHGGE